MVSHPLNFEAGQVPMPEDPRECDAALRAGAITYRIFPYYIWRYGERGKRFTHSDSAWLAWLTRHDLSYLNDQIHWLGNLLSNRGMPRWLMEIHLQVLYKKLAAAVPGKKQDYRKLVSASARLQRQRLAVIPSRIFDKLAAEFADGFASGPRNLLRGTAKLAIAAVADEKNGVPKAVTSIEGWLTDVETIRRTVEINSAQVNSRYRSPDHDFTVDQWARAIRTTIESARRS